MPDETQLSPAEQSASPSSPENALWRPRQARPARRRSPQTGAELRHCWTSRAHPHRRHVFEEPCPTCRERSRACSRLRVHGPEPAEDLRAGAGLERGPTPKPATGSESERRDLTSRHGGQHQSCAGRRCVSCFAVATDCAGRNCRATSRPGCGRGTGTGIQSPLRVEPGLRQRWRCAPMGGSIGHQRRRFGSLFELAAGSCCADCHPRDRQQTGAGGEPKLRAWSTFHGL